MNVEICCDKGSIHIRSVKFFLLPHTENCIVSVIPVSTHPSIGLSFLSTFGRGIISYGRSPSLVISVEFYNLAITESGIDGLELTRLWLARSFDSLQDKLLSLEGATPVTMATPAAILNGGYMELLEWDISRLYPEVGLQKTNTGK